eukprot:CAMPEP_0119056666 /NCGR_PEP_ID=MMETSP1178-20130426/1281_1 /TAXON_ID=33656 /ORGANISM="unid sp, Strain CCMP2000" /LENGTH=228 /DNA_ID=CAMNT_0007037415 /DNA_START=58 /DNA_END=744 /DNA_ORIENTATION=+
MKRARHEIRDLDLHPDHIASASGDAADGMLRRAKRQLSSSLEEQSGKLWRLRTTAEAHYENAPSARELRAATREAVRDNASIAAGAAVSAVQAVDEELDLIADEVAEIARAAAQRTAAVAGAVQAQAASAVHGIQAHGAAMEKLAAAGTGFAVSAARAGLRGAISYLQPRLTWANVGNLGLRAAPLAAPLAAKLGARPAPVLAAAKHAVATLALDENSCPHTDAHFAA